MKALTHQRGAIYCAINSVGHLQTALISAIALRHHHSDLPITIVSNLPNLDSLNLATFNIQLRSILIPEALHSLESLQSRYIKTSLSHLTPYQETLYLDADIFPLKPIPCIWEYIEQSHAALALDIAPTLEQTYHITAEEKSFTLNQCSENTPHYNSGVILWRNTAKARMLFDLWRQEWMQFKQQDQLALIRALHKFQVPVAQLPSKYNLLMVDVMSRLHEISDEVHLLHCTAQIHNGDFKRIAAHFIPDAAAAALEVFAEYTAPAALL